MAWVESLFFINGFITMVIIMFIYYFIQFFQDKRDCIGMVWVAHLYV